MPTSIEAEKPVVLLELHQLKEDFNDYSQTIAKEQAFVGKKCWLDEMKTKQVKIYAIEFIHVCQLEKQVKELEKEFKDLKSVIDTCKADHSTYSQCFPNGYLLPYLA